MSNIFKSNSRFAALAEDIEKPIKKEEKKNEKRQDKKEEKKDNIFKENSFLKEENYFKKDYQRRDNRFETRYESKESKEERIKRENLKKEEEKRKKEEESQKNLAVENFPDLSNKVIVNNNNQKNIISYSEKAAKTPENKENPIVIENNVKPGWVEIKRILTEERNFKVVYTYGDRVPEENIIKKSNVNSDYLVLDALVNLHNKRTKEYIDMYGYDTWEKMFRFPNYDYDYFDKLDAEYEMEEEEVEDNY